MRKFALSILFMLLQGVLLAHAAQDTLKVRIYFPVAKADAVVMDFAGNGERIAVFEEQLNAALKEGAYINGVFITASASPEGPTDLNLRLSRKRANVMSAFFTEKLGINPGLVIAKPIGEDWEGLAEKIMELDVPWKEDALAIIGNNTDPKDNERRKQNLRVLAGGQAWKLFMEDIFPVLRSAKCDAIVTLTRPEETIIEHTVEHTDTLYVNVPVETVVEVPVIVDCDKKRKGYETAGKIMPVAIRTNFLAIPFANVGIEVPLGQHFSIAADWYSPWMWRKNHSKGIDELGWCFEFQAVGGEVRYWFTNNKKKPEQRLLGHSVGIYAAAGHYDFERNYTGFQGKFANAGIDYMFACPIFDGRMHLEFELGLGFIYSPAIPYDTYQPGGKAYYRPGQRTLVQWFGPTRAQVNLVVPIYFKKGEGR